MANLLFLKPSTTYAAYRWKAFHDAIKQAYPHLKIIATTRPVTVLDPPEEYSSFRVSLSFYTFFEEPLTVSFITRIFFSRQTRLPNS